MARGTLQTLLVSERRGLYVLFDVGSEVKQLERCYLRSDQDS